MPKDMHMDPEMDLENDDRPIGRILSRREVLALLGAASATVLAGCTPGSQTTPNTSIARVAPSATSASQTATAGQQPAAAATVVPLTAVQPAQATAAATPTSAATAVPSATTQGTALMCVVRPEQTEGPYFVDEKLNRSDIRMDPTDNSVKQGIPLQLAFRVSQMSDGICTPLSGAQVDIWHCDALGIYSDVQDPNFGNTKGKKFLRGYQITDANGIAQFITIYPGWYQGRAVHIHFKIRTNPSANSGHVFTSQLYFDDALTDQIYAQQPYTSKGQRTMRNSSDGIYRSGGSQLMLVLAKQGDGYSSTFDVAMQTI